MRADQANGLLDDKVFLKRMDPSDQAAGLFVCSLPLPRQAHAKWHLNNLATARLPLGQWPGIKGNAPRRLLMAVDGGTKAPDVLRLTRTGSVAVSMPPTAALERFEESPWPEFYWERHMLKISWGNIAFGLVMGLRHGNEAHWWEACNLVVRSETPECRIIEAGGAIPLKLTTADDMRVASSYRYPLLHKHNWLNGHVYARLHSNGVCEIFAHHINSKCVDDGLQLDDAVPVIGFYAKGVEPDVLAGLCGLWDGTRPEMSFGGVKIDCRNVNNLAVAEKPGRVDMAGDFLVWQPYMAMELYGGICAKARTGDPWILHPEQKEIPRGMARTLRFSVSLNSERSPRVVRYQAPAWWYGLCEEFSPAPLFPVSNEYDKTLDAAGKYIRSAIVNRGFEDGSIARHHSVFEERGEPGWEGEAPYAQFLTAWRSTDAQDYDLAMRSAYYVSDVCVDHAACTFRMHGFASNAFALPMQRIHASVAAYLETGDPYLFQTARSVLDNSYWTHKNSWPRMSVGRDAMFIRGAVLLYRYFADEHYREIARDTADDVAAAQRPDGTFGDQGGGTGIHAWSAYITKPWMGLMAVGGLIDYLEVVGHDKKLLDVVKKLADWMLRDRREFKGVKGLRYQHNYHGGPDFYVFGADGWTKLPGDLLWHVEYLARVWPFCSMSFNDPAYFEAWAESHAAYADRIAGDHPFTQACQFIPWLQDRLWGVRLDDKGGLVATPNYWGPCAPKNGKVYTPDGIVDIEWADNGKKVVFGNPAKQAV